jgi:hypothetical protein
MREFLRAKTWVEKIESIEQMKRREQDGARDDAESNSKTVAGHGEICRGHWSNLRRLGMFFVSMSSMRHPCAVQIIRNRISFVEDGSLANSWTVRKAVAVTPRIFHYAQLGYSQILKVLTITNWVGSERSFIACGRAPLVTPDESHESRRENRICPGSCEIWNSCWVASVVLVVNVTNKSLSLLGRLSGTRQWQNQACKYAEGC